MIMYSEHDMSAYEKMLEKKVGPVSSVNHELVSPDLHIDVLHLSPTAERDYYTLITMGMGVYKMPVPAPYGRMNRAEIAIKVPRDWKVGSLDEPWAWPSGIIRTIARETYATNSWIGIWHDIDFAMPLAAGVGFCGLLLDIFDENIEPFTLQCGDQVLLYQAIPLYRSEIDYKIANGAEALLSRMSPSMTSGPIDISRQPVV